MVAQKGVAEEPMESLLARVESREHHLSTASTTQTDTSPNPPRHDAVAITLHLRQGRRAAIAHDIPADELHIKPQQYDLECQGLAVIEVTLTGRGPPVPCSKTDTHLLSHVGVFKNDFVAELTRAHMHFDPTHERIELREATLYARDSTDAQPSLIPRIVQLEEAFACGDYDFLASSRRSH